MGKVCGGTGQKNYMICGRGDAKDWDDIALLLNDTAWNWNNTLNDYKKSEFANDLSVQNNGFHSTSGKLSVSDARYSTIFNQIFLDAGKELGFPTDIDYNSGSTYGFAKIQTTTYKGQRAETCSAYVDEAAQRENLNILTNRYVTRVLIRNKKAIGIEYVKDGKSRIPTNWLKFEDPSKFLLLPDALQPDVGLGVLNYSLPRQFILTFSFVKVLEGYPSILLYFFWPTSSGSKGSTLYIGVVVFRLQSTWLRFKDLLKFLLLLFFCRSGTLRGSWRAQIFFSKAI